MVVAAFVRWVAASRHGLVRATVASAFSQPLSLLGNPSSLSHWALAPPAAHGPLLRKKQCNLWALSPQTPSVTPHCLETKVHCLSLAFKALV